MPSPIPLPTPAGGDDGLDSSAITAARFVAIAITALLVSFIVINRTSGALSAGAATPPSELAAGSVALSDDDGGRTLFDLTGLLPARPVTNCIEVAYDGTEFDGVVELRARGGGELAELVDITIESGDGGGFGDCAGFDPQRRLFGGTLSSLLSSHGVDGAAIPAMAVESVHQVRTFRVTVDLHDDPAAQGRDATLELLWSVSS